MSIKEFIFSLSVVGMLAGCASMGTPDGGPFDEEPPVFIGGSPAMNALNVTDKRITIDFNENIRLQNAFEKVVISPPQKEQPQIRYNGKRVTVQLEDSLIPNVTYSIDFNDAIVDNNEGNPLEGFAYVFSTGEKIDTLGISGTVLNAQDLEPIKGIMVGVHSLLDDSAFTTKPFDRVSRTDSRGRFVIKGMAPGKYRVYALADANGNYLFDQKSEAIAFYDTEVSPSASQAVRYDTIWRDVETIDTIRAVEYTRYGSEDIALRAFKEDFHTQYLVKYPRQEHTNFTMYFAAPNKELPVIEGLNFDAKDAYVLQSNATQDTLRYWFKDPQVYNMDTLQMVVTYNVLDSMLQTVPRSDTLYVASRKRYETVLKEREEKFEKDKKRFLKKARKSGGYSEDSLPEYIPPTPLLEIKSTGGSVMDFNEELQIYFAEPVASIDTSFIHLSQMVDTVAKPIPFVFKQNEDDIRYYTIYAEWRPEQTYYLQIDSAAFKGLYGGVSELFEQTMTFRSLDSYAVLYLTIPHTGNDAVVQLLSANDKVAAEQRTSNNKCSFFFIKPGKYSLRLFMDKNGNGKWDTGSYEKRMQPEECYYYPRVLDLRALFEYQQDDWDINYPLEKQKPLEVTKQKPEVEKVKISRNLMRQFK